MSDIEVIKSKAKRYTKGIVIGGVLGGLLAFATKRSLFVWGGLGAVAGGYIASKFGEMDTKAVKEDIETKFRNYDL